MVIEKKEFCKICKEFERIVKKEYPKVLKILCTGDYFSKKYTVIDDYHTFEISCSPYYHDWRVYIAFFPNIEGCRKFLKDNSSEDGDNSSEDGDNSSEDGDNSSENDDNSSSEDEDNSSSEDKDNSSSEDDDNSSSEDHANRKFLNLNLDKCPLSEVLYYHTYFEYKDPNEIGPLIYEYFKTYLKLIGYDLKIENPKLKEKNDILEKQVEYLKGIIESHPDNDIMFQETKEHINKLLKGTS